LRSTIKKSPIKQGREKYSCSVRNVPAKDMVRTPVEGREAPYYRAEGKKKKGGGIEIRVFSYRGDSSRKQRGRGKQGGDEELLCSLSSEAVVGKKKDRMRQKKFTPGGLVRKDDKESAKRGL